MKRLSCRLVLSLSLAAMAAGMAGAQPAEKQAGKTRPLVIASGVVTGLYYPMAGALCRQINQQKGRHGYRCLVEATDGPVYNLNALREGEVDLALVQSDWQAAAVKGEGRMAGAGPFKQLRAVATLHAETVTLLVRPDAEIDSLAKLKGKRFNLGPRGSALRNLVDTVLDAAGVRLGDDDANLSPDAAAQSLCSGDLDAAFFAVGHPNATVRQAVASCGAVILPIAGPGIDKLLTARTDLTRAAIPAAHYPGLDADVPSIGVAATLVTRADVDAKAIGEVVRVLLEERPDLEDQHPAFSGVTTEGMGDRARTAPLHPAAEKAFAAAKPAGKS